MPRSSVGDQPTPADFRYKRNRLGGPGQAPQRALNAGDTFFVEKTRIHETINGSGAPAKILATYTVEKGKPLATPAP
jgi:hypothetical protein